MGTPELPYKMKDQMSWSWHLDILVKSLHEQLTMSSEAEGQVRSLRTLYIFLKPHWDGVMFTQLGKDKSEFMKMEKYLEKRTGFDKETIDKVIQALKTYKPALKLSWSGVDDNLIFGRYEAIMDLIERKGLGGTKRTTTVIQ